MLFFILILGGGAVQVWPGLRGLARARAAAVFFRRQGAPWSDIEGRSEGHPTASGRRCNVAIELARAPIDSGRLVARKDAGTEAEDVGRDCAGEQDGPATLGDDDEE